MLTCCVASSPQVKQRVAVHVPCSSKKMGVSDAFTQLAALCAEEVVPSGVPCCGASFMSNIILFCFTCLIWRAPLMHQVRSGLPSANW